MRPSGAPSAVMSKKTTGLDIVAGEEVERGGKKEGREEGRKKEGDGLKRVSERHKKRRKRLFLFLFHFFFSLLFLEEEKNGQEG